MDVLEDEERRLASREGLDEDARREEERVAVVRFPFASEAEEHPQVLRMLGAIRHGSEELDEGGGQLRPRLHRLVAVEDSRDLLDVLREDAVRAARTVRHRAASERPPSARHDFLRELEREARLSDPGGPEHRHEARTTLLDDALPGADEHGELTFSSDHRRSTELAFSRRRDGLNGDPGADRE